MMLISCSGEVKFHTCNSQYDVVQVYRPNVENNGSIRSVSWCRDGSLLVIVPFKGNTEIVRTKDDVKNIQTINSVLQPTAAVFQRTTKKNVAIGTANGNIVVYDIKQRSTRKLFAKSGPQVQMLEWNYKDTHLGVLNTDGIVSLYSNTTNQKTSTIKLLNNTISSIRFHQTYKNLLGCASNEGSVAVWDNNVGKNKFFAQLHKAPVTDLVFSSQNNSLLTSVGLDRSFQCYDTNEGEVALSVLTDQPLSAIDMAPNGYTITLASIAGTIYIYDLRNYGSPLRTLQEHDSQVKRVLYQPQETGSIESINLEPEEKVDEVFSHHNTSVDSFAQIINSTNCNEFSPHLTDKKPSLYKKGESFGDSFLNDLSPARNKIESYSSDKNSPNELSNLGITDGVKKWIDSKVNLMDTSVPQTSGVMEVKKDSLVITSTNSTSSSTPVLSKNVCIHNFSSHEMHQSPIVMASETLPPQGEEYKKVIREVVTEVTQDYMNDLMDNLSRSFLNLQLCISKQFVNQEEMFANLLKSQVNNHNLQTQIEQLREENEFLKKKLNDVWRNQQ